MDYALVDWSIMLLAIAAAYIVFGIAGFGTALAAGLWIGRRLTLRMSREAFVRLVTWLVLASGLALLYRYFNP
ncbi:hypothetical protein AC788_14295 [Pseudomonas sp. RIT-PI-a]|jgi:uncharacterized membrane protein YfcA|nr:hypothetical protein AC788_14295 [Pseudomonas sp. RIT-PI-a]